jgi:hypothetical protein
VAANSEHFDARLAGDTVTSSGEVRESSVRVARSYTFRTDHIACGVQLAGSAADQVFVLWGGAHGLRGMVDEAWEMIPFVGAPGRRRKGRPPKNPTLVTALGPDGKPLGDLTDKPVQAAAVRIDRRGYGVVVELDRTRPVHRGSNDTLLIQLVGQRTPASQVALRYRLVPYVGEPGRAAEAEPKHALALLPAIDSLDKVAGALAAADAHTVRFKGKPLAELRFAVAGDRLAVAAQVVDPRVAQQAVAWKGSCVELFGSMPEGARIGQVFLVPAAGDAPPRAYRSVKGKQTPAPEIRLASQPTPRGYALQALVPLSLLALDAAKGRVLLEAQVSTAASAKGGSRHATLFGSKLAYMNNRDYGLFRLGRPAREEVEK